MQKEFSWIKTSAEEFSELTENSAINLNSIFCQVCNRIHKSPKEIPDCYTNKFFRKFNFAVLSNKISIFYGSDKFLNLLGGEEIHDELLFGRIFDNHGKLIDGFKSFYPKSKIQLYGDEYKLTHCRNCGIPIIDYIRGKAKINTLSVPDSIKVLSPFSDYGIIVDSNISLKIKEAGMKYISISKIKHAKVTETAILDYLNFEDLNKLSFPQ